MASLPGCRECLIEQRSLRKARAPIPATSSLRSCSWLTPIEQAASSDTLQANRKRVAFPSRQITGTMLQFAGFDPATLTGGLRLCRMMAAAIGHALPDRFSPPATYE